LSSKPPAAKKPRVRNPGKTREKLLQATVDLLAEKGPDALSLKEAARNANVSRGVAYQHFEDKDHLLAEAKAWISDRLFDSAKDIQPALKKKNVQSVMEERVSASAKIVLNNRDAARLLIVDALAGKALDTGHPLYKMVVADLEALKASGGVRKDADIEMLTYILLGAVSTTIMLSHIPNAGTPDQLAERFSAEWTRLLRDGMIDKAAPQKTAAKPKTRGRTKP
jgi:AcrR family transcriptional regulator